MTITCWTAAITASNVPPNLIIHYLLYCCLIFLSLSLSLCVCVCVCLLCVTVYRGKCNDARAGPEGWLVTLFGLAGMTIAGLYLYYKLTTHKIKPIIITVFLKSVLNFFQLNSVFYSSAMGLYGMYSMIRRE